MSLFRCCVLCFVIVLNKRQAEEKLSSTTPLWCRNGGTLNGDKCDCPVQYSGRACHRLIRDCSEPFENGYRTDMDGAYYIQPDTNENAFLVNCKFEYDGVTYALVQTYPITAQHDWNEYKQGFGDDPMNSSPYFIGLDNLHRLTRQSSYELNIWLDYEGEATIGGVLYYNFTIGPEETMYEIAFDALFEKYDVDDWFEGSSSVQFVAPGQDVNNCSSQMGKAGWLGSNCTGYGVFSTGDFYWPVNGELKKVTDLSFMLVRLSSFYEV
ncbi:hypothetical protein V1264_006328 [Littorina saxatilis]|uniref:Fibrinogen C-terminal domain-containing protein n=1 Tax=Littorina saxatilis TaxID=31220 RepID=A0AAN9AXH4_9CAEN